LSFSGRSSTIRPTSASQFTRTPATAPCVARENFGATRRRTVVASDDGVVTDLAGNQHPLLALYDEALPEVYGYLLHRCGDVATAQDLTSETFLAAASAMCAGHRGPLGVPWLIGTARHKLIDHWRRRAREERVLSAVGEPGADDPWDAELDRDDALRVLRALGEHHRSVLTLRYMDDLPVRQVAAALGRTEHATEALLVRARAAFRRSYEAGAEAESDHDA
jgi:RNA polymerase sigma-70 factor (ECF subfamily)